MLQRVLHPPASMLVVHTRLRCDFELRRQHRTAAVELHADLPCACADSAQQRPALHTSTFRVSGIKADVTRRFRVDADATLSCRASNYTVGDESIAYYQDGAGPCGGLPAAAAEEEEMEV